MENIFVTNFDVFLFVKASSSFSKPSVWFEKVLSIIIIHLDLTEEEQTNLKHFCQQYVGHMQNNWISCSRSIKSYLNKFETWLQEDIIWPAFLVQKLANIDMETLTSPHTILQINEGASTSSSVGTSTTQEPIPRKNFAELSPLQKRRRTEQLLQHDSHTLAYAAGRSSGNKDVADVIKLMVEHPEKAAYVKGLLKGKKIENIKFTVEKALGIFISLKLTKWQYITLRACTKQEGIDLYPNYNKILKAKKDCYPAKETLEITERGVKVQLQAILDITVSRLSLVLDKDYIEPYEDKELTLVYKWGFDGASGQSNYKQKMETEGDDDSSIFMCSFVPLRLTCAEDVIWENAKPSSTLLCRPLYFKFAVENKLDINEELNLVKAEIAVLKPTIIGKNITVRHSLLMTMIDGKITSHLSNTSAQTCDICKAVPTEMNNLEKVSSKPVSAEIYQYGLSTLHAWIRCMECLLHIAYRLDFKKWAVRDASNKEALKKRKLTIQNKFRDEMGLLVDIVKQGSGTSNDGNTARRFFEDAEKTAAITGLNPQLISRFSTILRVISCGEPINVESFSTFSYETAHLYVELYSWYYMPSSVHKLLVHGSEIIKHFNLMPIGKLSEEASEARNKDFRKIREHHTRKFNRSVTNEDIFNGLLLSSDPYLSSTRPVLRKPKHKMFSEDMMHLLLIDTDKENIEFVDVNESMMHSVLENLTSDDSDDE